MNDNEPTPQGIDASDIAKVVVKASNWKTYVIYALLVVIAVESVGLLWQRGTVKGYEVKIAKHDSEILRFQTERDIAKANEKSCRVNLDDQNKKLTELGNRFKNMQNSFSDIESRIKSGEFTRNADNVRKQPTPKTCQEAVDFINRNLP